MDNKSSLEILDRVSPIISKLKGRKICNRLINDMNRAAGKRCFIIVERSIVFVTPERRFVLYNGYDDVAGYGSYGRIASNDIFPALLKQLRRKIRLNLS